MTKQQKNCEECDRRIPLYQKPIWFKTKRVCERCFFKLKENDKMDRNNTKVLMVGLI